MHLSQALLPFLAQAAAPAGVQPAFNWQSLMFPVLVIGAMWFLLIAPQRTKAKEHAKMLASIKAGDEILTSGGIFGTVITVRDDRYVVRIGDSTKVEVAKSFVTGVEKKSDSDSKSS